MRIKLINTAKELKYTSCSKQLNNLEQELFKNLILCIVLGQCACSLALKTVYGQTKVNFFYIFQEQLEFDILG